MKSKFYYPAALLADLASNHLAHRINSTDTMPRAGELVDERVRDRLATLGEATVELAAAIDESAALGSLGPVV